MKALLRKDLYQLRAYCKSYLLVFGVFMAVSLMDDGKLFYCAYATILCGAISVSLLGYDERSKWSTYAETLPVTRAQMVSAKYLIGLLCNGAILAMLAIGLLLQKRYGPSLRLFLLGLTFCLGLVSGGFCLPFIYRFGIEKGRVSYYFAVGIFCAISFIPMNRLGLSTADVPMGGSWDAVADWSLPGIGTACLVCAVLYAVSWLLSIRIYQKREIS